jgi:hypothetical protein
VEGQTDGLVRIFAALILEDSLLQSLRELAEWWSERMESKATVAYRNKCAARHVRNLCAMASTTLVGRGGGGDGSEDDERKKGCERHCRAGKTKQGEC